MDSAAGKARIRIKIACEECRKNKRKCDGQKPSCYLCKKFGRECVYATEQSRKRRHYDEDLVRNLENQIKLLESALKSRSSDVHATVSMADCENPTVHVPSALEVPDMAAESTRSLAEDRRDDVRSSSAMEELATLMLEMDIAEKGEPSFTIAAGKRKSVSARDEVKTSTIEGEIGGEHSQSDVTRHFLPPEILDHLVDCFAMHFNTFHQFLDINDVVELKSFGINVSTLDLRFRNAALLSVAACLSSMPEAKRTRSTYASLADGLALRCIKERPNDIVVQGLTLLAWKELMFGVPSLAYNYIAMATGQILHLGLHVTALMRSPDGSNVEQALYKRHIRSFWAYFSVDRLLTSSLGMNCTLHWQRVRLHPFKNIVEGEPTLDEVAHDSFCQLWHLWDSSMDQVYAFGWAQLTSSERESLVLRSHQSLTDFYNHIDDRLRLRKDHLPDSAVWFQMAYHTALLLIHRPLLNEPRGSSALKFALRSTTTSAASISRIIRSYRRSKKFESLSPQVIDYILSAAVIHLLNATSGQTILGRQSANGLRNCVEALEEMKAEWSLIATRSLRQIQDLAHRWNVIWALPLHLAQETSQKLDGEMKSASYASSALDCSAGFTNHHGVPLGSYVAELGNPFQNGTHYGHMNAMSEDQSFWDLHDCFWDELVGEYDDWMVQH